MPNIHDGYNIVNWDGWEYAVTALTADGYMMYTATAPTYIGAYMPAPVLPIMDIVTIDLCIRNYNDLPKCIGCEFIYDILVPKFDLAVDSGITLAIVKFVGNRFRKFSMEKQETIIVDIANEFITALDKKGDLVFDVDIFSIKKHQNNDQGPSSIWGLYV
jgi:hypothetical protein